MQFLLNYNIIIKLAGNLARKPSSYFDILTSLLLKRKLLPVANDAKYLYFNSSSLSLRVPVACVHPDNGDRTLTIYLPSYHITSLPLTHKTASYMKHQKDRGKQQSKHVFKFYC